MLTDQTVHQIPTFKRFVIFLSEKHLMIFMNNQKKIINNEILSISTENNISVESKDINSIRR